LAEREFFSMRSKPTSLTSIPNTRARSPPRSSREATSRGTPRFAMRSRNEASAWAGHSDLSTPMPSEWRPTMPRVWRSRRYPISDGIQPSSSDSAM